jgi:hypothetical protein
VHGSIAGDLGPRSPGSSKSDGEKIYFAYSADLRIFGDIPSLDEITQRLGLEPTESHKKGTRGWGPKLAAYKHDMWSYHAQVNESEPLHTHIDALWKTLAGHREYLVGLKERLTVDVFLGYRSNGDHAGVEVPYHSLEMFRELQVPFGLSIIVI